MKEYLPKRKSLRIIIYIIVTYWLFGCIVIIYRKFIPKEIIQEEFSLPVQQHNTVETIYNEFYVDIYDTLFHSEVKFEFEIVQFHSMIKQWIKEKKLKQATAIRKNVRILDVGCGTGKHLKYIKRFGYRKLTGLDISKDMTIKSKKTNPMDAIILGNYNYQKTFAPNSFTHITCFFFTIYYAKDFDVFFKNMNIWLEKGGYLLVHIVNREKFDPILDRASSVVPLFSPQKHVNNRITNTQIIFNKFKYTADWKFSNTDVMFNETIEFNDHSNKIKNTHSFFIPSRKQIVKFANRNGFELIKIIDQFIVGFEYNYIYCFKKKE